MATLEPITLHEGNDETVTITIVPETAGDDLTTVDELELVLKDDRCDSDAADTNLVLSTTVPAEMVFTTQALALIVAEAYIPASALVGSYPRWYRVDTLSAGGDRRTAVYGKVTMVDL